jgi:hypothetical protein
LTRELKHRKERKLDRNKILDNKADLVLDIQDEGTMDYRSEGLDEQAEQSDKVTDNERQTMRMQMTRPPSQMMPRSRSGNGMLG